MSRLNAAVAALLLAMMLTAGAGADITFSPKNQFVLTDKEAFGLLPPEIISGPVVREAKWSPDGRYVLAIRERMDLSPAAVREAFRPTPPPRANPPGEICLVAWNRRTRRSLEAWKRPLGLGQIEQFAFLPGSESALAVVTVNDPPAPGVPETLPRRGLLRIDVENGQSRVLTEIPAESSLSLEISPTDPVAVVSQLNFVKQNVAQPDGTVKERYETQCVISVVRDVGPLKPAGLLPRGAMLRDVQWPEGGRQAILHCMERSADPKQRALPRWYALNPQTAQVQPLPDAPHKTERAVYAPELRLRLTPQTIKEGDTARAVHALWMETVAKSDQPRALVCADASWYLLAPRADAALYFSQDAAWVTPLLRLTRAEYDTIVRQALKATAINNAKQLGLGLLMYAQDWDEKLPGSGDDVRGMVSPYVKNNDLFDGFVYTFPGGGLANVSAPADTEMGYVTGPGGRAVVFVDGHVKWKDD